MEGGVFGSGGRVRKGDHAGIVRRPMLADTLEGLAKQIASVELGKEGDNVPIAPLAEDNFCHGSVPLVMPVRAYESVINPETDNLLTAD